MQLKTIVNRGQTHGTLVYGAAREHLLLALTLWQGHAVWQSRDREMIALVVSVVNECHY